MTTYKFTVTGQSKDDGNFYQVQAICQGMSKYELEQFIKEQNFKEETIKVTKVKLKK